MARKIEMLTPIEISSNTPRSYAAILSKKQYGGQRFVINPKDLTALTEICDLVIDLTRNTSYAFYFRNKATSENAKADILKASKSQADGLETIVSARLCILHYIR